MRASLNANEMRIRNDKWKMRKKDEKKKRENSGKVVARAGRVGTRWEDSYGKIYDKKKVFTETMLKT